MIPVKTAAEIKLMAEGGRKLAGIMKELEKHIRPGVSSQELDRLAESLVLESGGRPSFKGYEGFPNCLCVSLNNVIVHGRPSNRKLKEGDLVSLDIGMLYRGFHTDMARTWSVGLPNPLVRKLIDVTKSALAIAAREIKPGKRLGDVECATQEYVEKNGFNVVRQLCGHGIGRELHEEPEIMNFGKKGTGPKLKEGMVFCLEPMVTVGDWKLRLSPDGFGYETVDGSLCCHFEDTIAVTARGPLVLTEL
jgi:methionyl aminopeptidase